MNITSSAFEPNQSIPYKYTCEGDDACVPLKISDVPTAAKSLALIVFDPDAQGGKGFTHWVVWNIPTDVREIPGDALPAGAVQGQNGMGKNQWMGPCPPTGTHHYQFMLYALDTELELPAETTMEVLLKAMEGHVLEQETLVGLYKKVGV